MKITYIRKDLFVSSICKELSEFNKKKTSNSEMSKDWKRNFNKDDKWMPRKHMKRC